MQVKIRGSGPPWLNCRTSWSRGKLSRRGRYSVASSALFHRRTLVGATSGRLVVMYRSLFGGFRLHDVRWQDLKDVTLRVGLFGADLHVLSLTSSDLAVAGRTTPTLTCDGLRKAQAQNVYRICQTHEQAWREKRRVRELEELRAKSGGDPAGVHAWRRVACRCIAGGG